jgi:phosphate transport system substrate-binding protein
MWFLSVGAAVVLAVVGCGGSGDSGKPAGTGASAAKLSGEINIDGSSTVYIISEAMAKAFKNEHPDVKINVGISGTGGGFKKFTKGETDISDASRAIKDGEKEEAKKNNIEYTELQVAWDGITVVIHKDNTWAKKMTVEQLKKMWHPDSQGKVMKWSDIDSSWPNEPFKLFGPGPDSGTFDYFTEVVNGKERAERTDVEASQNPEVLVKGVAGNKYALGYFGLAYYEENTDKLNAVAVENPKTKEFVLPSEATVLDRTYAPLSRPLYIYVKSESLKKKPEVQEFAKFYLRRSEDLVKSARYVPMKTVDRSEQQAKLEDALKALK